MCWRAGCALLHGNRLAVVMPASAASYRGPAEYGPLENRPQAALRDQRA